MLGCLNIGVNLQRRTIIRIDNIGLIMGCDMMLEFVIFISLTMLGCLDIGVNLQRRTIRRIDRHWVMYLFSVYAGVSQINCGICKYICFLILSLYN